MGDINWWMVAGGAVLNFLFFQWGRATANKSPVWLTINVVDGETHGVDE